PPPARRRSPWPAGSRGSCAERLSRRLLLGVLALAAAGLHLGEAAELAGDAVHLALGGEALVEALVAEGARLLGPGGEALGPALDSPVDGLRVFSREI